MTTPPLRLPLSLDGLDAAWLQRALAIAHPGTQVDAVRHARVLGGSLTKVELEVDYGSNPHHVPSSLYVKAAFEDHGIPVSMRSEALFYAVVRPLIDVNAPQCFYAEADGQDGIVVMANLVAQGCTITDPVQPWSPSKVADGLAQLAGLHAGWWGEGRVPDIPVLDGANALGAVLMAEGYWEMCVDGPTGQRVPARFRDREQMRPRIQALWALDHEWPRCFLHGDAHLGNTYVDGDGRPGFLDWGGVTSGHWAREVCYFLAGALSVDDRRHHEETLLAGYLDALAELGVADAPGWDAAWLSYRRHMIHGLLWFLCPTQMQPVEVIDANVARFAAAAEDHAVDTLFS